MSDAQSSATNPYIPHCCATDSQDLYGRDSILMELKGWLDDPQLTRGFLSISGGHKIGKSSVLRCFRKIVGTGSGSPIIVYCDLSRDDLISRLQEEITRQSSPSPPIPSTTKARRQGTKEWIQAIGDRQLYVLLDSYDRLVDSARNEDEERTKKRELFELLAEWIEERSCGGYAFATWLYKEEEQYRIIRRLKARAVVARVRVADIIKTEHDTKHKKDLELLKKEDALTLIRQARDQATPRPFCRSDEKLFILKQAGCHPHWLQALCWCLYEEYRQRGLIPCPGAALRLMKIRTIRRVRQKAIRRVREEYLDIAFKSIWNCHLKEGTLRKTLTEIARNPGMKYRKERDAFTKDVERLKREGVVQERKGGRIATTGKLFEAFVCEQEKDPNQRRWYEPCSPFRQKLSRVLSPRLHYVLLAIPTGLFVIFKEIYDNLVVQLLALVLLAVVLGSKVKEVREVRNAIIGLSPWLWICAICVLIVIVFIAGITWLSQKDI